MNAVRFAPAVLLLAVLAQARAQSSEELRVGLRLDGCAQRAWHEDALRDALQLELRSDASQPVELAARGAETESVLEVSEDCAANHVHVQMRWLNGATDALERAMDLSGVAASLRARTLALGLAELLRAGRAARTVALRESAGTLNGTQPSAAVEAQEPEATPRLAAPVAAGGEPGTTTGSVGPQASAAARGSAAKAKPAPGPASAASTAGAARAPTTRRSAGPDAPHKALDPGAGARPARSQTASPPARAEHPTAEATRPAEAPEPASTVRVDSETEPDDSRSVDRGVPPTAASFTPITAAFELTLAGGARWLTSESTALFGGRVAVRWYRVLLGVEGFFGGGRDTLGQIAYGVGQALAGYDLVRAEFGGFIFSGTAYAGLGVGWGRGSVSALADAASDWSLAWSLGGQVALLRAIDVHWLLAVIADVGFAYGPRFNAGSRSVASLWGPFGSACLGIVWRPVIER